MTHIKRIGEIEQEQTFANGDYVRIELSSNSYSCMFAGEDDFEELIETNKHITGKTVETFTGGNSEIVWNLNIKTGTIDDWDCGEVCINFKVVDSGVYTLVENGKDLVTKEDYVPDFLQIDENGYGDYVEITVDENGHIYDWGETQIQEVFEFFNED